MSAPSSALAAEVRDHVASEYEGVFDAPMVDTYVAEALGTATSDQLVDVVARRVPAPADVLDVGAGYGSFVRAAAAAGYRATGVEIQPYEVATARRLGPDSRLVRASGLALPFDDGAFDVVTFWNVVEHVPSTDELLAEARRVLRPGGTLVLVAPNYSAFRREAHYQVPWAPLLPRRLAARYLRSLGRDPGFFQHHIHYCTNGGVRRRLTNAGFEVHDPRVDALDRAATSERAAVRFAARLRVPARWALRATFVNPLRRSIRLVAIKR